MDSEKMKRILVLDNYDSFTYNLVHLVEKILPVKADVVLNDQIELEQVSQYDKIILSPGPGLPAEAGLMIPLINRYASSKSILGVCLGHQAIAEAFGAKLHNLPQVFHGVATPIDIVDQNDPLFQGLHPTQWVGRYHSWVVSTSHLPDSLRVTAVDQEGNIMGLRHKHFDVQGIQFHPESILTPGGEQILSNWLQAGDKDELC